MALSVSRPDPSSPASVADATFSTARRGFDQAEVRALLHAVAAELGRLQERERFLERELRTAREQPSIDELQLDDETVTRLLGEETARVLQTARESAVLIRQKAEDAAARLLREATDEAARLREEAEVEAARRRSDAAADAEAELSLAKQQGREMVNEARAYRERVLSELGRRRELAREQIEQLIHGRDRLLQVFERARLVAVDVVADLAPLGGPDEYVDLTPTTGPVPVMVPAARMGATASSAATEMLASEPVTDEPAERTADPSGDLELVEDDADPSSEVPRVDAPSADEPAADDPAADTDQAADADETASPEAAHDNDGPAPDAAGDQPADDVMLDEPAADVMLDEPADEPVAAETPVAAAPAAATNVVHLFPSAAERDPDVDGLFARLRAETAAGGDAADAGVGAADAGDQADDADDAEAADDSIFQRRDAALVPLIVAAARKLKRVLADEQNDVLDTLRRKEPVTAVDAILPSLGDHVARYATAVEAELRTALTDGAATAADLDDPAVAERLADAGALDAVHQALRTELVEPLRARLERAVGAGAGDNDDITRGVRAVYREWKTQHIDDHLDDLFRLAHGTGILRAVAPGTPMCWLVDPDGPACPDAEDNALAGVVPAGEPYPTGDRCAPAHAGCRCVLAPLGH